MKTPIPKHIRQQLSQDPFMLRCCITGEPTENWHHALIYGGKAVQAWWAILPVTRAIHEIADRPDIRKKLVKVMKERGGAECSEYEKVQSLR